MEHEHRLTEILANAITHGIGVLLALAGAAVLIYKSASGSALQIVVLSIYCFTLLLVYLFSTLYHSLVRTRARRVFQSLDHSAIYLLIAGTYSPFTLLCLKGWLGWSLCIGLWCVAIVGVTYKSIFGDKYPKISLIIYLLMGWVGVVALGPFQHVVGWGGINWIFAGGAFYTLGVYFHSRDHKPFHHALWHIFVLLGSVTHFFAVYLYALPRRG